MTADINTTKYTPEELQKATDIAVTKFVDSLTYPQQKKLIIKYLTLLAMTNSGEGAVEQPDINNVCKCILVMLNDKEIREELFK